MEDHTKARIHHQNLIKLIARVEKVVRSINKILKSQKI